MMLAAAVRKHMLKQEAGTDVKEISGMSFYMDLRRLLDLQ